MPTSLNDSSQRMLNALESGMELPILRHRFFAETVIIVRGSLKEIFYNDNSEITDVIIMQVGEGCSVLQIPMADCRSHEIGNSYI